MSKVQLLGITHKKQYGNDADLRKADCLPAVIAMLGGGTVDEAALLSQGDKPNEYVTITRGMKILKWEYGIKSDFIKPLTNRQLRESLKERRPVILLIKYAAIPRDMRGVATFTGSHFVLAVGYNDAGIYIHDPLQQTGYVLWDDGLIEKAMSSFQQFENQPYQAIGIRKQYPQLTAAEMELITGERYQEVVRNVETDSRVRRILYELGVDPFSPNWYADALTALKAIRQSPRWL